MKQELYGLASSVIKTAKSAGAADCRASIESERFVEIGYRDRKPETIKEASTKSLQIEVFVNNRFSLQVKEMGIYFNRDQNPILANEVYLKKPLFILHELFSNLIKILLHGFWNDIRQGKGQKLLVGVPGQLAGQVIYFTKSCMF